MKTSTLDKNIARFARKFGITNAKHSDTFYYDAITRRIYYTVFSYQEDKIIDDIVSKKYNINLDDWYFVFRILHEIGHHLTLNNLSSEEIAEDNAMRFIIETVDDVKIANETYFSLPSERAANEWAIKYLDEHISECWKFQRKCGAIMRHLYKKNFSKTY